MKVVSTDYNPLSYYPIAQGFNDTQWKLVLDFNYVNVLHTYHNVIGAIRGKKGEAVKKYFDTITKLVFIFFIFFIMKFTGTTPFTWFMTYHFKNSQGSSKNNSEGGVLDWRIYII